jgi:hypothetical protein
LAQQFNGSLTSYASQDDMIVRFDVRTLGDLLADNNVRLTSSQVQNSTVLAELLLQASGELETACIAGQRYLPADLSALRGASQSKLKGIVCSLAFQALMDRRPNIIAQEPKAIGKAFELLNQLRQGERIFSLVESEQAGFTVERIVESCALVSTRAYRMLGGCGPNAGQSPCSGCNC